MKTKSGTQRVVRIVGLVLLATSALVPAISAFEPVQAPRGQETERPRGQDTERPRSDRG